MDEHLVSPSADVENGQLPEGWRPTPLRDVAREFFGGGTPSTNRADFWDGDIPWTTSAHISDDLYVRKGARLITKEGLSQSSSRYVPAGNLLIGTRVGVGKAAINALGIAISQDLTGMIVDQGKADVEFLAYAIRSDEVQRQSRNGMRGTTIKGIPRDDLQRVEIPLPPLPEQRRIAHVLSAIQRAIQAQDAVIAAARELKRSLMQRLFTYGPYAEPMSTKETEIGEMPEGWELANLGDIATIERGKFAHRPRNAPEFYRGTIPFIQTGDVTKSNGRIRTYTQTLNELGLSISRMFPKGTIVITIAANIGYTGILEFDSAFPDSLIGITPNPSVMASFLEHFLRTQQPEMDRLAPRGTQKNINIEFLKPWPVPRPSFEEQATIVRALDIADSKIETEVGRKTALEALFKSMLHQLMTGQVRVPAADFGSRRP